MKFVLTLFSICFIGMTTAFGQTLAFSQVLLVDNTQTVPANRVWKIVSASSTSNFSSSSQQIHLLPADLLFTLIL
jgi:hypothetical protein